MTYDDLTEHLDDMGVSGDTPLRLVYDGVEFDVAAITKSHDGSVVLELEEA